MDQSSPSPNPLLESFWHPRNIGKPNQYSKGSRQKVWLKSSVCGHEWEVTFKDVATKEKLACPYCSGRRVLIGFNDLQTVHPEIAKTWSPRNRLSPRDVTRGSSRKFWWRCSLGHEWEVTVSDRVRAQSREGCPYCARKKVLTGFNDLATTHPELARDWSPNNKLSATEVIYGTHHKYLWIHQKCHHEVEATPTNRNNQSSECVVCSGEKIVPGENDLFTLYPHFADQWHPTKNKTWAEDSISCGSMKKAWWVCEHGHEWESIISNRTRLKSGCPYCSNQKTARGINDLPSSYPEVAKEWHPVKNRDLILAEVNKHSSSRVWWQCQKGHEWQAVVSHRTRGGQSCPYCAGQRAIKGENDLQTLFPGIAREWHPHLNDRLPEEVAYASHYRASWICQKGHEWQAVVAMRTGKSKHHQNGCPQCASSTSASRGEKELLAFVQNLLPESVAVEENYKGLPGVHEVDIYIPSKRIAIEFNGLYWHSNAHVENTYHYEKLTNCKKQGVRLIQIWEDEWEFSQDIVKKMIAQKLGVSNQERIMARKTSVSQIPSASAAGFLDEFHIQGASSGSLRVGIHHKEDLVAVAIFKRRQSKGEYELVRYATSTNVVGGLGKILAYVIKNCGVEEVVTFADNCVSEGGLYETLGFKKDGEIKPDYKYIVGSRRVHKFNYRLKRFKSDPTLQYDSKMTESELAQLNNLLRVYDAGKTRYRLTLNKS
jgi:uncharacterized Zn-finger protein